MWLSLLLQCFRPPQLLSSTDQPLSGTNPLAYQPTASLLHRCSIASPGLGAICRVLNSQNLSVPTRSQTKPCYRLINRFARVRIYLPRLILFDNLSKKTPATSSALTFPPARISTFGIAFASLGLGVISRFMNCGRHIIGLGTDEMSWTKNTSHYDLTPISNWGSFMTRFYRPYSQHKFIIQMLIRWSAHEPLMHKCSQPSPNTDGRFLSFATKSVMEINP